MRAVIFGSQARAIVKTVSMNMSSARTKVEADRRRQTNARKAKNHLVHSHRPAKTKLTVGTHASTTCWESALKARHVRIGILQIAAI